MLFIITSQGQEITWKVGQPRPMLEQPLDKRLPRHYVTEIVADGSELNHITSNFLNLRKRKNAGSVSWFGSDAQFIVANLVT